MSAEPPTSTDDDRAERMIFMTKAMAEAMKAHIWRMSREAVHDMVVNYRGKQYRICEEAEIINSRSVTTNKFSIWEHDENAYADMYKIGEINAE